MNKISHEIVSDDHRYRFVIQVGFGRKGSYKTRYSTNNTSQAELLYRGINIGNGYKKRIVDNGKVVQRDFS